MQLLDTMMQTLHILDGVVDYGGSVTLLKQTHVGEEIDRQYMNRINASTTEKLTAYVGHDSDQLNPTRELRESVLD